MWSGASLAYGILRIALAGTFLADYGLDVRVFAVVELTSAALLGAAGGRLVDDLVRARRGRRVRSAVLTVIGYGAPDAYVLASSGRYPGRLLTVVVTVVAVSSAEIDEIGIQAANLGALSRALDLVAAPEGAALVVDGFALPMQARAHRAIVKGDATSAAIAAASIIAKKIGRAHV